MSSVKEILQQQARSNRNNNTIYDTWCRGLKKHGFMQFVPALTNKEKSMLKKTAAVFGKDDIKVFEWFLETFQSHKSIYKSKGALFYNVPTVPATYKNRNVILSEYLTQLEASQVNIAVRRHIKAHPKDLVKRSQVLSEAISFDWYGRHELEFVKGHRVPIFNVILNVPNVHEKEVDWCNDRRKQMGVMGAEVIDKETGEVHWHPFVMGTNVTGFTLLKGKDRRDKVQHAINAFGKETAKKMYSTK